ncbi:DUF192 domain-containing protein [Altererythrobacter arenosus]|uniref:DUF192 domain-containing protein n=1 Tax=Altererythrobacter arenosus TaxID=3032592 RepID=A0ABY8FU07_9SPHN|nr:DUF192 domain-containing protein [Altererythrobacter sp. CAU 1644]WFL78247.1 DUF192 domain-containing protein [Altererythrobacter sp. CAU 1644]
MKAGSVWQGVAVTAAALALSACSTQAVGDAGASETLAANARHPISGLRVIVAKVESGRKTYGFQVELANTPEAQARGLMFRTELADDEGMLFPSEPPAPRSFWMRNTPIPLDIIFVGVDGRITNIAAETTPYSLESSLSDGLTSAVLEIRGGRAAELGIGPGDKVTWNIPE